MWTPQAQLVVGTKPMWEVLWGYKTHKGVCNVNLTPEVFPIRSKTQNEAVCVFSAYLYGAASR